MDIGDEYRGPNPTHDDLHGFSISRAISQPTLRQYYNVCVYTVYRCQCYSSADSDTSSPQQKTS